MIHFGTVRPGSTLQIPFDTFVASSGANATLTNFAVGDILVYKDGNTTARASTTGYTADTTFSSIAGINRAVIDLSSDATADFYKSGSNYFVVIGSVTADGQNIYFLAASFSIGYESAVLNTSIATLAGQTSFTLTAGPAEDDALNGMWCLIHDKASAVQTTWACVLDYTGSTKTVTLASIPAATFTIAAIDNISFFGPMPLQPTVMGNKLDVSAGGEAGVDWANVGSPTTTVGLSGTTVKTATDVETDTADIQSRIPAALSTGNMKCDVLMISGDSTAADNAEAFFDGTGYAGTNNVIPLVTTTTTAVNVTSVNGLAANVITATSIASSAITDAKIASDAITAAKIADGAIDAATFAAGAINAAAIANGAIDAATFAADVPSLAMRTGTADGGDATHITLDSGADASNDFYNDTLIFTTGGAGAGQSRYIIDYVGATKVAEVDAWIDAVDNTTTFAILPAGSIPGATAPTVAEIVTGLATDTTAGNWTVANSFGKSVMNGVSLGTGLTVNALTTNNDKTGYALTSAYDPAKTASQAGDAMTLTAGERNAIADATLARSLAAESYAADGAAPTMSQALYGLLSITSEFAISGTTITCKKLDGSTTSMTFTLDDATTPTSRTRAT